MKTITTEVERFIIDKENLRLFQQERVILETTELICRAMDEHSVSKAELARRLGKNKAYVTLLLDGRTKMTLRKISDAMWALNCSLHVFNRPLSMYAIVPKVKDDNLDHLPDAPVEVPHEPVKPA